MRERNGECGDSSVDREMGDLINIRKVRWLSRRMSSWKDINWASNFFICICVFSYTFKDIYIYIYIFVTIFDL